MFCTRYAMCLCESQIIICVNTFSHAHACQQSFLGLGYIAWLGYTCSVYIKEIYVENVKNSGNSFSSKLHDEFKSVFRFLIAEPDQLVC